MRQAVRLTCLSVAFVGAFFCPAAASGVASHFDADNEGWQVVDYPFRSQAIGARTMSPLAFDGAEGLPAGSVRVGDVFGETGIAAPAAFLGDMSAYYGGSLAWDILIRYSDGVAYPALVLSGATMSLYWDAPAPVLGAWTHVSAPLVESGWKVGGTQVDATRTDMLAVLESLSGIYIYTEWRTGPDDTSVDNIVLTSGTTSAATPPAPQPSLVAFPNPFNPHCTLRFELPAAGPARLAVFDVAGRLVRVLAEADLAAGPAAFPWDGRDDQGNNVGSGTYLARLEAGGAVAVTPLQLVR